MYYSRFQLNKQETIQFKLPFYEDEIDHVKAIGFDFVNYCLCVTKTLSTQL